MALAGSFGAINTSSARPWADYASLLGYTAVGIVDHIRRLQKISCKQDYNSMTLIPKTSLFFPQTQCKPWDVWTL